MNEGSQPAHNDIVVCQQRRGPLFVYVLRGARGPDQILVRSLDTALDQAAVIASRQRVRAWLTSNGQDHIPLDQVLGPKTRAANCAAPGPLLDH